MAYGSGPYRIKTNEQKAREQEALQAIEGDNAKARQGTRTDLQDNIKENFPESETGQARDIAARAVGWSGRTDDTRAMDLYDQALQRKPGEHKGNQYSNGTVDNVNISNRPTGNTEAYALRKLRRDAPQIHNRLAS